MQKDGFTSLMSAILNKAVCLKEEGNEKLSLGGTVPVTDIPFIDLGLTQNSEAHRLVRNIEEVKEDAVVGYTDGSMSDGGRVGEGGVLRVGIQREYGARPYAPYGMGRSLGSRKP